MKILLISCISFWTADSAVWRVTEETVPEDGGKDETIPHGVRMVPVEEEDGFYESSQPVQSELGDWVEGNTINQNLTTGFEMSSSENVTMGISKAGAGGSHILQTGAKTAKDGAGMLNLHQDTDESDDAAKPSESTGLAAKFSLEESHEPEMKKAGTGATTAPAKGGTTSVPEDTSIEETGGTSAAATEDTTVTKDGAEGAAEESDQFNTEQTATAPMGNTTEKSETSTATYGDSEASIAGMNESAKMATAPMGNTTEKSETSTATHGDSEASIAGMTGSAKLATAPMGKTTEKSETSTATCGDLEDSIAGTTESAKLKMTSESVVETATDGSSPLEETTTASAEAQTKPKTSPVDSATSPIQENHTEYKHTTPAAPNGTTPAELNDNNDVKIVPMNHGNDDPWY